ncbi:MAG: RNA polymerase factor sigma-54 [Pikeienuella sp.]|uniref:RNA polymerase factor sigma-54 n=1 Tax=Pikeienuella sp. TaxID=2831957 RepID=UPI00391DF71F
MKIGPRLEIRQRQQLVMTPQLQQAIRLLQMSGLDVAAYLSEEAEKNPLLHIDEGGGEAAASPGGDAAEGVDRAIAREDPGAAEQIFETGRDNLYEGAESRTTDESGLWGPGGGGRDGGGGGATDPFEESFAERTAATTTLRDHLLPQIALFAARPAARALASLLVDELDDAGYLRADLDDLAARLGARGDLVAEALAALQACDPAGIGARDLRECLALQLRERNRLDPAMEALLARLDDLAAARMDRLRAACGVDDEDLAEMIAEIRRLDPRPGSAFSGGLAATVTPDVFVRRAPDGGWAVELNADALPRLLLDRRYAVSLAAEGGAETRAYLAECRQNADWLLRALDQRARTILKVATEIVRLQSGFFENGVSALSPMTLRAVAERIEMHESTVSRVTANKYLSCARGAFELKFFFTQAIAAADGGDAVSAAAVRHSIRSLIEAEDAARPLSDDRIVTLLKQNGVDIARRTVAKYREGMSIPSSAQRKRMKANALVR